MVLILKQSYGPNSLSNTFTNLIFSSSSLHLFVFSHTHMDLFTLALFENPHRVHIQAFEVCLNVLCNILLQVRTKDQDDGVSVQGP